MRSSREGPERGDGVLPDPRRGFVLDAGAFIALEGRDGTMKRLAERFVRERTPLVTSAGVVAQIWRGGTGSQAPVAFLLTKTTIVDLTDAVARVVGRVLGRRGTRDPIDAHVALLAHERDWTVITSDPDDLLAIDPTLTVERV